MNNTYIYNISEELRASSLKRKRDKSIVLFGAWFGNNFSDNSRFLYQYLSKNKESLELTHVVWVTRNANINEMLNKMGYESYMMDSVESIYFHKKALYHIICNQSADNGTVRPDILVQYSNGAVKINLWHAAYAIKGVNLASRSAIEYAQNHPIRHKIGRILNSIKAYRRIAETGGWRDCYYLSSSESSRDNLNLSFGLPKKNFIISCLPRTQKCLELLEQERQVIDRLKKQKRIIVLYLPTFREAKTEFVSPSDDSKFVEYIAESSYLWVTKKHEVDNRKGVDNKALVGFETLPSNLDVNVVLPYVDVVVSDYSSVVWDALYYNKHVVFYVPDLYEYDSADRGLVMSPNEFLFAPYAKDFSGLINILKNMRIDGENQDNSKYQYFRTRIWDDSLGYEDIWNKIQRLKP